MKNRYLYFLVFIMLLTLCVSRRCIYTPSVPNIPYFKQKGDAKVSALYGSSSEDKLHKSNGLDINGAYAISDHVGITTSYFYRSEKDQEAAPNGIFKESDIKSTRNLFDAGAGYYLPLSRSFTSTFNIYAERDIHGFPVLQILLSQVWPVQNQLSTR